MERISMRARATAALLGVQILCASCGGGGGGGGAPTAFPHAGPTGQLTITSQNSAPAAGLALGGTEYISTIAWTLLAAADDGLRLGLAASTENCFSAGSVTLSFADADGNAALSARDSVLLSYQNCEGVLSGTERFVIETLVETNGALTELSGQISFDLTDSGFFTVTIGSGHVSLSSDGAGYDLAITQIDFSISDGTLTDKLSNGSYTEHSDGSGDYLIAIQGLASSAGLGGSFSYRTDSPLQGFYGQVPSSGRWLVQGFNSAVRFATTDLQAGLASAELDSNGNGQYVLTSTVSWGELVGGPLFGFGYGSIYGNQPPEMTTLSIEPTDPVLGQDLSTHFNARDPDNDILTAAWQWQVNGVVQSDLTGATFPAERALEGDQITVTVTVSDGTLSTSETASATIGAPVLFLTSGPLPEAHFDELLTVPLSIVDMQGSTVTPPPGLEFELVYGPAGMTVDPATGLLSWEPAIPVFEPETAINWSVRTNDVGVAPISGTLILADPDRRYPTMWAGLRYPSGDNVEVGDFDADGIDEVLVLGDGDYLYELEFDGQGYAQSWSYPFQLTPSVNATAMTVLDVDGDGYAEIFVCVRNYIAVLDGRTRRSIDTIALPAPSTICSDLKIADLNGDGQLELIALINGKIIVVQRETAAVVWQSTASDGTKIAIGNVDADSALEIVSEAGNVYDGSTFVAQWSYMPGFGSAIRVGDVDGDGVGEIVASGSDLALRVFDAESMSILTEMPDVFVFPFWNNTVALHDIQGDATLEIIAGSANGSMLGFAVNPTTTQLENLFQYTVPFDTYVGTISIGDTDGDGDSEYVISGANDSGDTLLVVAKDNGSLSTEWVNSAADILPGALVGGKPLKSLVAPTRVAFAAGGDGGRVILAAESSLRLDVSDALLDRTSGAILMDVGDVDSDGIDEAVVALERSGTNTAHVLAYDFDTGIVEWEAVLPVSDKPIRLKLADVNNDGKPDILLATTASVGQTLRVHDGVTGELLWQSTVPYVTDFEVFDDVPNAFVLAGQTTIDVYVRTPGTNNFSISASYGGGQLALTIAAIAAGDLDGDGVSELYAAFDSRGFEPDLLRKFDSSLQLLGTAEIPATSNFMFVENLGYPRKNLVLTHRAVQGTGAFLSVVDPRSGAKIMASPKLHSPISQNNLGYADFRGDGKFRMSFATDAGMFLTQ